MSYFLIMLVNFFFFLVHYMSLTLLPLYALHIGGNNTHAGLMTGVFTMSALLFRPLVGKIVDTKGRKPVMIGGLLIIGIISFSYIYCNSINRLLVLRLLQGIGFSAGTTAITTVLTDILPIKRMTEGIGYFGLSNAVAQALGPMLGLYIIVRPGYAAVFLIMAAISIIGLVCVFFVKDTNGFGHQKDLPAGSVKSPSKKKAWFIEPVLTAPAVLILFLTTANGGIQTFVSKYAFSMGIIDIGPFFAVFAFSAMISRIFAGKISYRLGLGSVVVIGMSSMLVSQLILVCAAYLWVFLAAAVFYGLGLGLAMPGLNSIFVLLASPDRKGRAIALFYSAIDLGIGGSSILWGVVSQAYGFPVIYLSTAVCCLVAIFIFCLSVGRQGLSMPVHKTQH
ncbi:MFS transporter [Desulfocastanea catecholica]